MSSTSQKHRNFVAEPMGEKACTGKGGIFRRITRIFETNLLIDLAGIGETLGKRLTEKGFDKVR